MIKGILLTILLVILIILIIVFLILAIVKRKNASIRNRYIVAAAGSFLLSILLGGYLLYKTIQAGKYYSKQMADTGVEFMADVLSPSYPMDTPQMKRIRAMQPQGINIPGEYYTYAGFRDYYRMPLIYPYSLVAIDIPDRAILEDESGVKILLDSNKSESIFGDIIAFRFNSKAIYAITQDRFEEESDTTYVVMSFATRKVTKTKDEETALSYAIEEGLDITESLQTVQEYYSSFSSYN